MRTRHILYLLLGWAFLAAACGQTSDTTGTESSEDSETMLARVEAAVAAPGRSADDKAIDSTRKPVFATSVTLPQNAMINHTLG